MNDKLSMEEPHSIEESQLSELLAAMPREKASASFTARVLKRIETVPTNETTPAMESRWSVTPRWSVAPLLAAAALLFLSLGFGGRELWHRHQRQETIERYETLRAEHEALEKELHRLRRLAVEARPVVYLGGDENVEYVVDLSGPQRRREGIYPTLESPAHEPTEIVTEIVTETATHMATEMDDLSPSQLRQHPRRIY